MYKRKPAVGRLVCLTLPVFIAFCVGTSVGPRLAVRAGVREPPPTQHFLSGGERAVPVLKEISETLKQIETRLSRIETVVARATERQDSR